MRVSGQRQSEQHFAVVRGSRGCRPPLVAAVRNLRPRQARMITLLLMAALALEGRIPEGIEDGCHVMWIDATTGDVAPCRTEGRRWSCDRPDTGRGIAVAIGSGRVAVAGGAGVDGIDPAPALWGRVVRVDLAAGPSAATLHAWRPDRSAVRTQLRRFRPVRDAAVRVLKLDEAVFWVDAVGDLDRDAYLVFDSVEAGPERVTTNQLRD